MGWWVAGERASGHSGPGHPISLLRLWAMGCFGSPTPGWGWRVEVVSLEPSAALVPSLAGHHPTGCSQELPPPQLQTSKHPDSV